MKRLITLIFLLILQSCSNPEEEVNEHLSFGKSYYQKGEYGQARNEFNYVLQLNTEQVEAYYHLALIDEKTQNWEGMLENLTKVTELDPKNKDAILKLGRFALLAGHYEEALTHVEAALKQAADNPEALALKGAIFVKQGKLEDAMPLAGQILNKHPWHIGAIALKTAVYLAKKDTALALATLEKALRANQGELSLLLLRLQVHQREKDSLAVEQDYLDLIKKYPDKFEYSYALAKHYSENNQEDKALSTFQALIGSHPDKMQPKLALVEYLLQTKPDLAEKTLAAYLAQFPKEPDLHFWLASLYLKQNKVTEAKQALNMVVGLKPKGKEGLDAKLILAKIAIQENDPETALKAIEEVLSVDQNHYEGSILKARLDLQKGLYDGVISNLRKVLEGHPNSADALVLIGQAYLNNNLPELAEESFREALSINPASFDALMPVILNLIKNKEAAKADQLLNKALKVIPDHPSALQALAQVRTLQKDWIGAQKVADAIANKPLGAGFSKFLSGKISEGQGYYKEATGQYKEALILSPELSEALSSMAGSYEALNQNEAMYAYLEGFMAGHPDKPYPRLLKSRLLLKDKRVDEAIDVLSKSIEKWPKAVEFYETLANCYLENKELDKAETVLKKGLETNPDNVRLSILLASIADQTGDYPQALGIYEALVAKYPSLDLVANNLASLLLDRFNTKENIARALSLAKRLEHSEQPVFVDTYAWSLINSGRSAESVKLLQDIVKKMPEVPVFRYHLGTAYHKTNNKVSAIAELKESLRLGEKTGGFAEKGAAAKLLQEIN